METHSHTHLTGEAHGHSHDHSHDHSQGEAVHRVHTAPVVMDIGEQTGSLVIYTPPEMVSVEIEISPRGNDSRRAHTDVAERRTRERSIFAAVYLPMPAGVYTLWAPEPYGPTEVTIASGAITELDWR